MSRRRRPWWSQNPQLANMRNELAFVSAFAGTAPKPYWLLSVSAAEPKLDVLGVDCIAAVRYPGSGDTVRVPIQLKGHQDLISEYYVKHPEALRARVVVLAIRRDDEPATMRQRLVDKIIPLRQGNVRFDAYFASLERTPLSQRMRDVASQIAQRRVAFSPQTLVLAE